MIRLILKGLKIPVAVIIALLLLWYFEDWRKPIKADSRYVSQIYKDVQLNERYGYIRDHDLKFIKDGNPLHQMPEIKAAGADSNNVNVEVIRYGLLRFMYRGDITNTYIHYAFTPNIRYGLDWFTADTALIRAGGFLNSSYQSTLSDYSVLRRYILEKTGLGNSLPPILINAPDWSGRWYIFLKIPMNLGNSKNVSFLENDEGTRLVK